MLLLMLLLLLLMAGQLVKSIVEETRHALFMADGWWVGWLVHGCYPYGSNLVVMRLVCGGGGS